MSLIPANHVGLGFEVAACGPASLMGFVQQLASQARTPERWVCGQAPDLWDCGAENSDSSDHLFAAFQPPVLGGYGEIVSINLGIGARLFHHKNVHPDLKKIM